MEITIKISPEKFPVAVESIEAKKFEREATKDVIFLYQVKRRHIQGLPDWLTWSADLEEAFVVNVSEIDSYEASQFQDFVAFVKEDLEPLEEVDCEGTLKAEPSGAKFIVGSTMVGRWLSQAIIPGSDLDSKYAVEYWVTERVYLTREEAEGFGNRNTHNHDEWRVYGVPSYGALEPVLQEIRYPGGRYTS